MKRGALLLALLVSAFGAACSGGGNSAPPPPPVGGFSNSSLKGQYAFIMTGQAPDGFIARVGSFVADGNGGISGGTELVDTFSNNFQQLAFSSSSYQVQADGRGAINLTNVTGTLSFSITMTSTSSGIICETDGVTGTSGTFELQDTSAFTKSALSGSFVFDNAGLDPVPFPNTNPDSIVGQIVLNGGTVSSGVYDENDGSVASGPVAITSGSYSIADVTNGLGSLAFNNFQYAFVIVNSRKFHMIEVPPTGTNIPITAGTANAQTAPPATTPGFNGNFAFLIAGVGTHSQNEKAGRFTSDGSGGLGSIVLDDKQLGNPVTQIPSGSLSATAYTIDTNFPGSGRGTATFHDSSKGTFQFVFYMSSATQGVIQDNSTGLVGDGVIMAQTGAPFSQSSFANDYAFNGSGVSRNGTTLVSAEEDFVGHVKITSAASDNVTGAMDFSELNSNQGAFHDSALTGGLTINGDGTNVSGRSGLTIKAAGTNGGPSTTFPFTVYAVNPQTIFVISQDNDRVTGGTFTVQVTPP